MPNPVFNLYNTVSTPCTLSLTWLWYLIKRKMQVVIHSELIRGAVLLPIYLPCNLTFPLIEKGTQRSAKNFRTYAQPEVQTMTKIQVWPCSQPGERAQCYMMKRLGSVASHATSYSAIWSSVGVTFAVSWTNSCSLFSRYSTSPAPVRVEASERPFYAWASAALQLLVSPCYVECSFHKD